MSACKVEELVVAVPKIQDQRHQCQRPPDTPQHAHGSARRTQHEELIDAEHRVLLHDALLHQCLQEKFHL